MGHTVPLTYRKATASDVSAVVALVRSAYRGEASREGWTTEADYLDDQRIDAAGCLAKIERPDGAVLLVHDETGTLTACCELQKRSDQVAYFGLFAVDPKRQAGGIGRQVLAEAEAYAKKTWGVSRLEMTVIWLRDELIAWYIRRGYEKTNRTEALRYHELVDGKPLRDDLYFTILAKSL